MFRLKEAFARAKSLGLVKRKTDLAQEIWGESSPKSAYMNFSNLEKGKVKKVDTEVVLFLCERLDCSLEYLFGLTDCPKDDDYKTTVREKAEKIIELCETL